MIKKGRFRDFIFKTKIFLWYLVTEPFRQVYEIFYYLSKTLNKSISWVYVFLTITIIALIAGRRPVAGLVLIVLLAALIMWEWQSGFFMYRYRQNTRRKIEKTLEEKESDKL